jgi:hypothetical protein
LIQIFHSVDAQSYLEAGKKIGMREAAAIRAAA